MNNNNYSQPKITINKPLSSSQAVQRFWQYLSPEAGLKWTAGGPGLELIGAQSQLDESSPLKAINNYSRTSKNIKLGWQNITDIDLCNAPSVHINVQ